MTILITSTSLRQALALSPADRRWIDFLTTTVSDTWDPSNPIRPRTHAYVGSEDFLRLQYEEYILSLISCSKYHQFLSSNHPLPTIDGDPSTEFNSDWIFAWMRTRNFRLLDRNTEVNLFDIIEPRHPTAGALSLEDVRRRIMAQVTEMRLDEKLKIGKEVASKHLATGKEKVSTAINNLWAEVEARRESQRQKSQFVTSTFPSTRSSQIAAPAGPENMPSTGSNAVIASATANLSVAGAYLSSWSSWASEKRRKGGWMTSNSNLRASADTDAARNVEGQALGSNGATSPTRRLRGEKSTVFWDSGHTSPKKEEKGRDGIGRLDA